MHRGAAAAKNYGKREATALWHMANQDTKAEKSFGEVGTLRWMIGVCPVITVNTHTDSMFDLTNRVAIFRRQQV